MARVENLLASVRACTLCDLPLGPRPVLQMHPDARVLIAGQAPGSRVHATGVPFDDPSGDRLRDWLGVDKAAFYNPRQIALLPMAFCYPGKGKGGDLPPPPLCAQTWRARLLSELSNLQLTVLVGRYAIDWHLAGEQRNSLRNVVTRWREFGPNLIALPHPSPRNNLWLRRNPVVDEEIVPELRRRVSQALLRS